MMILIHTQYRRSTPDGVEFIASLRKLIGNPTTVQDETEYTYTVTDDAEGTDELEFNITVTAAGTPNAAPVVAINTDAPASAVAAGSFVVAYTVADTDTGDTVTPTATIMVVPSSATAHYSVSEADGMVTITQAEATTMTIPAATVTVTITANDGTVDSEPMMLSVAFAAAMYTPPPLTNVAPVVDITTQAPAEAVTTGSFAVAYDVTDTDTGDTVTPTATIMVVPSSATAHYSVSEADGMVTITQAEATTMTIPAATVTVTITANDGTVDSEPMTLSVAFEAAMYTLPDTGTPALAFSDTSIADRAFTAGTAIGTTAMPYFQLPDATGGQSPYVYTLHRGAGQLDITATGHNGLTVDLADLRLSGSPTAADASGTMFTWRATDANDDVVALNFTITVSPAGAITPPTVKAVATFSGTLSLTGRSIITITFDKAVAALTEADFTVTGGDIPANGIRAKDVTAPTVANTIWEVAIDADPFAQSVSITINSTSTVAQAAAGINGRRDAATPKGTLNLIDAATGADDTAKFVVTLTFAAALPAGTDVVAADLTVTPATAVIGAIASNLDRTVWEVEITPTASSATTVDLSTAGKLKFATGSSYAMLSVATKSTPPSVGDITATKATAAGVTTVTLTGSIAANGFATIGSASLPNLEEFFTIGGTIGVDDGDAADDKNSRSVVVSEILWGLDYGETDIAKQNKHQFIELYNTTSASIDLAGWKLKFTEGRPVPASDIDQVSNRADAGWAVNIGQSGRVTNTTADGDGTSAPINIVSMYRKINYTKVEKVKDADGTADPSREEQLKGIPGANVAGGWAPSIRASANGIFSSKGRKHFATTAILKASFVARSPFIINEVGNGSGDTNDWVEIRNVDPAEKSLNNHHLSYVSGFDTDTSLVNFKDKDIKVPGNGVILLVNTDPKNTGIAAGRNAAVAEADQELTGATSRYYINSNLKLPDDGKFNLILRNAHDKLKASSHFMDVIGGLVVTDNTKGTSLWPLVATGGPHGDVVEANGRDLKSGYVYIRKNAGGGTGEHHLGRAGYTGVGYDRAALKSDANGGTPGYENNAVKGKVAELSAAEITISEIMVDTGEGRQNLAQWIELYNSSMTQAVSLGGWKLAIENANSDVETALNATLSLDGMTISPNQTVLIVSTSGRVSDPDHFPSSRVVNLWTTKKHRDELEMVRRTDQVFSATGFHFKLTDADNKLVDEAGNLDGNRRTRDEIAWEIPTGEDDDRRSSLIRVYDEGVAVKGTSAAGWISADETNLAFAISETYYGDPDDFGTPGFRGGGPLPVSLSKFRPELLDSGEIVVRWITESELNNAGFNILRSETRNGEFTKLNTKLIAGQGTTSERTVYSFPDTSAKPNVVYYYQIQDVSLDGKVQTLRQSRLKGNISADGKLTTTWGEIKALQ